MMSGMANAALPAGCRMAANASGAAASAAPAAKRILRCPRFIAGRSPKTPAAAAPRSPAIPEPIPVHSPARATERP